MGGRCIPTAKCSLPVPFGHWPAGTRERVHRANFISKLMRDVLVKQNSYNEFVRWLKSIPQNKLRSRNVVYEDSFFGSIADARYS